MQLLRASRQWRDLKSRMIHGIGHQQGISQPAEGSMAIFCPACPQPGINLPNDWKEKYSPYEFFCFVYVCLWIWLVLKESTYSNLHNGWQLFCRAHEMQSRSYGRAALCGNGIYGNAGAI